MSGHLSKHDKFFRLIMADKSIAVDYFRICLPANKLRIGYGCYLGEQGMDMKKIREIMEKDWTVKQIIEYFGTDDIPKDSIVGYFVEQGLEQGREQGMEQGREITARAMIRKGYTDAQICDLLEVAGDYVAKLRAEEV